MNEPTNANEVEQRRAALKRYKAQYRALYDELVDILFQLDPISVHVGKTEKFVPEPTTIMARLREARVAEDVEQIVLQELRRWYGRRRLARQDPERLTDATIAICRAWNRFSNCQLRNRATAFAELGGWVDLGGQPPRPPDRAGRAQFGHPAPQITGSLRDAKWSALRLVAA